jgi:putative acetyltransferase
MLDRHISVIVSVHCSPMLTIAAAIYPDDSVEVIEIWREYISYSSVNLDYQQNRLDISNLPGEYAPPAGCILLARESDRVVGCIAMRRVDKAICEMKRLYVRPVARGTGLGLALSLELIEAARNAGYREIRLDVHGEFIHARQLYADLGFTDAEPVSYNPVPGAKFLGLLLT